MSEPVIHWEYKLWDVQGKRIKFDPKFEITETERYQGVVGLMLWNRRVRKSDGDIEHSFIRSWFQETGEPKATLIEMDMTFKDGYFNYRGKFPIVII